MSNNERIIKACNLHLDFSERSKKRIIKYCGIDRKVILDFKEQVSLFGVPLYDDLRYVSLFCKEWGVTMVGNNNLCTVSYSWHGLITMMLKRLFEQDKDNNNE